MRLLLGIAVTAAVLVTATPTNAGLVAGQVAAASGPITVANAASFETGAVARGALWAIYTTEPVTDEHETFGAWVSETPGGVYVETDSCRLGGDNPSGRLRISYIGPSGFGGTQINAYAPNNFGDEPYGKCSPWGADVIKVNPKAGFTAPAPTEVDTVLTRPGMFAVGDAPSGYHLNAVTQQTTSIQACNSDQGASLCPVSTNGVGNFLILYTSGGEYWMCPVEGRTCDSADRISFELAPAGGAFAAQPHEYYGASGYTGVEQANVRIRPGTGAGEHRMRITTPGAFTTAQQLTVWLGPAN